LGSSDETEALSALAVLEQQHKSHLVPPLLAYHPSREVSLRVLDVLARSGRRDVLPLLEGVLKSEDPERRAAALRAAHAIAPHDGVLEAYVDDDSPRVRAMALVPLARAHPRAEWERRIEEILQGRDAASQVALVQAMAHEPDRRWIPALITLAGSVDRAVRVAVVRAAQHFTEPEIVPMLIGMLASRDVRDAARDALVAFGAAAVPQLGRALADPLTPLAVRRHIPRTLARLPSAETAGMLTERLLLERDGMTRYKILRALGRMRALDPHLPLDRELLHDRARVTLDRIIQLMGWRVALEASDAPLTTIDELRIDFLREKQRNAVERVFRLLGLLAPSEDLALVYDGLRRDDPKARAASREILASSVAGDIRDALLVIVDDLSDAEKLLRLRGRRRIPDAQAALAQMISDRSEGVRLLATHHRMPLGRNQVRLAFA
jgi:HEAT repeat protein